MNELKGKYSSQGVASAIQALHFQKLFGPRKGYTAFIFSELKVQFICFIILRRTACAYFWKEKGFTEKSQCLPSNQTFLLCWRQICRFAAWKSALFLIFSMLQAWPFMRSSPSVQRACTELWAGPRRASVPKPERTCPLRECHKVPTVQSLWSAAMRSKRFLKVAHSFQNWESTNTINWHFDSSIY